MCPLQQTSVSGGPMIASAAVFFRRTGNLDTYTSCLSWSPFRALLIIPTPYTRRHQTKFGNCNILYGVVQSQKRAQCRRRNIGQEARASAIHMSSITPKHMCAVCEVYMIAVALCDAGAALGSNLFAHIRAHISVRFKMIWKHLHLLCMSICSCSGVDSKTCHLLYVLA